MPEHVDRRRSRASSATVTRPVNEALAPARIATGRFDDSLNGVLLDRSHVTPPHQLGRMIVEELCNVGARDVAIWLQDYDQRLLHPLHVPGSGDHAVEPVDASVPGRAFALHTTVEYQADDGSTRAWAPLLDGTDRV